MIIYLIKSGICLAILLAIYHLFLEKEKMHQFNRFYLLGSILFSFYAPSFIIYTEPIIINEAIQPLFSESIEINTPNNNVIPAVFSTPENNIDFNLLFIAVYLLISSLLFFRFSKNLIKITYKINNNQKKIYKNAIIVLTSEKIIPHTFLHYIFINKKEFKKKTIEDELFTHELTHVSQKHTFDILLIELLQIICWFNPLIIYLKKAIKLNHEFLADDSVIQSHKNTTEYQHLLLNKATLKNNIYLASNFNYSLTKKRLIMMTKQSSQLKMLFKKIAIIPLVIGLLFLFANRVEAQIVKKSKTERSTTNLNKNDTIKLYKEFYYKDGKISYKDENGKKITKSYEELTEKEKAKIPPPPPLKSKENTPTKTQLNNWLDSKTYGLWIDGKKVNNSVLKKYKSSDFSSYFLSKIHKNTVNYGKYIYQLNLQTNDYFQRLNQKNINAFKKYKKSQKELKNIPPPPPIPAKATKEKKKVYKKTTEKYKKSQKELKNIPPPPPPKVKKDKLKNVPPPPPIPTKATKEQKQAYKKATDKYKKSKKEVKNIPPPPPVKIIKSNNMSQSTPIPPNAAEEQKKAYLLTSIEHKKSQKEQRKASLLAKIEYKKSQKELQNKTQASSSKKLDSTDRKTGYFKIKDETFYYFKNNGNTMYFNKWGEKVTKKGKILKK